MLHQVVSMLIYFPEETQCFGCQSFIEQSYCLPIALDRLWSLLCLCVRVCSCVCKEIGCRTITSAVLYRFLPDFACGSAIYSTLFAVEQYSSKKRIDEKERERQNRITKKTNI